MPIHGHFSRLAMFASKVGQTDLDFGIYSGFISKSVQARLHVSVCSDYDLCHPGKHPDTHTEIDT